MCFKDSKSGSIVTALYLYAPAPCGRLRGSTSRRLPRAGAKGCALSCSAALRTALRRFASQLREPASSKGQGPGLRLVSLRGSGSPAVCLRRSASPSGSASLRRWSCFAGHESFWAPGRPCSGRRRRAKPATACRRQSVSAFGAAAAPLQALRPAERPPACRSSRRCSNAVLQQRPGGHRVLRYYLARQPAVFVGPAPWSSCRSGEAPAAGTKTPQPTPMHRRLPCKDTASPAGADFFKDRMFVAGISFRVPERAVMGRPSAGGRSPEALPL